MSCNKLDGHIVDTLFNEDYDSTKFHENSFSSHNFISKPIKSKTCTIDENIIQLQYPLLNQINALFLLLLLLLIIEYSISM